MGWLLNRETVIGLAVLGGAAAMAVPLLRERLGQDWAMFLHRLSYGLTGASMLIFIYLGLTGFQP